LKLSADQEAAMLEAAEPDAVLRLLNEHDNAALERLPIQERHAFVVSKIERARGWAVESTADLALYCMLALSEGEDFDERPNWQAALAPVRARKALLADAVAEVSP
jgi:aspartate/methionine/tyrosine aminotransferase